MNLIQRFTSILLVVAITFMSISIGATSLETKLNSTKQSISAAKAELKQNQAAQSTVRSQINSIDTSINQTEDDITSTEKQIATLEATIKQTEIDIEEAQKNYDAKYELRKGRMVAYYKAGATSLEESVSKVSNESDKMYLERAIEKVVSYDTNLINEIEQARVALEEKKASLEDQNTRLASLKADLEVKLASLESSKSTKESYLTELKSDQSELEKSIDDMNKEADKLAAEIKAASSTNTKYTGGKMTWPLPGSYIITSPFGNRLHPVLKVYKLHTGVDIAGNNCNGKPVVAAADGTVIVAKYNVGYGNYIVIDHGGGITTLYGHSSKLEVKVGDKVKAGQEIMKVGTTGYSTGPHLHFEVRENGNYVDPIGKGYIKVS